MLFVKLVQKEVWAKTECLDLQWLSTMILLVRELKIFFKNIQPKNLSYERANTCWLMHGGILVKLLYKITTWLFVIIRQLLLLMITFSNSTSFSVNHTD